MLALKDSTLNFKAETGNAHLLIFKLFMRVPRGGPPPPRDLVVTYKRQGAGLAGRRSLIR
jgi:hypothetical protein